jgi:murein tripeptide amidase MpaA
MTIPVRTEDDHYHFHVYDYMESAAFKASPPPKASASGRFYSLQKDLAALAEYGRTVGIPGISLSQAGAPLAELTSGLVYTLVLTLGNMTPGTPTVLFTGGIHGNEWIAPEFVYLLAEYLVKNYPRPDDVPNSYGQTIRDLVRTRCIQIIPMLNPVGNWFTVFSTAQNARLWRKNLRPLPAAPSEWEEVLTDDSWQPNPPFRNVTITPDQASATYDVPAYRADLWFPEAKPTYHTHPLANKALGVDLNRNFRTRAWGHSVSADPRDQQDTWNPGSLTYFGPQAGSEKETANLSGLLGNGHWRVAAIDYHSYGEEIVYPSETYNAGLIDPDYRFLGRVLEGLTAVPGRRHYTLGSADELLGYVATGAVDDMLAQSCAAHVFTIELDPPDTEENKKEGKGFLLPETAIRAVFEKNIRAALAAIMAAPGYRTDISAARDAFSRWRVSGRGNQLPS